MLEVEGFGGIEPVFLGVVGKKRTGQNGEGLAIYWAYLMRSVWKVALR
jgi:hypothetical protein